MSEDEDKDALNGSAGPWVALGAVTTFSVTIAEGAEKLLTALVKDWHATPFAGVLAPLVILIVFAAAAIRGLWNPFGPRGPRIRGAWRAVLGAAAVVSLIIAVASALASERSLVSQNVVIDARLARASCGDGWSAIEVNLTFPPQTVAGTFKLCTSDEFYDAEIGDLVSHHFKYLEDAVDAVQPECHDFGFRADKRSADLLLCFKAPRDVRRGRPVVLQKPELVHTLPAVAEGDLGWIDKHLLHLWQ